jgi:hypothetical protein
MMDPTTQAALEALNERAAALEARERERDERITAQAARLDVLEEQVRDVIDLAQATDATVANWPQQDSPAPRGLDELEQFLVAESPDDVFSRPWACTRCHAVAGEQCKHIPGAAMAGDYGPEIHVERRVASAELRIPQRDDRLDLADSPPLLIDVLPAIGQWVIVSCDRGGLFAGRVRSYIGERAEVDCGRHGVLVAKAAALWAAPDGYGEAA